KRLEAGGHLAHLVAVLAPGQPAPGPGCVLPFECVGVGKLAAGLLEIREHGLPARRPVHFGSFGLDVPIHPREYTTRWWWGEPDLRLFRVIDRHLLRRRVRLGGVLRGTCGRW